MAFNKRAWNDRFGKEISNQDALRRLDAGRLKTIWLLEVPDNIDSHYNTFTTTDTSKTGYSSIKNTDISEYIPPRSIKVRGAIIYVINYIYVNGTKTKKETYAQQICHYSLNYNTTPEYYGRFSKIEAYHTASDADNARLQHSIGHQASVPVTWNGNTPYITWYTHYMFGNMTSVSAKYESYVILYILGFYI